MIQHAKKKMHLLAIKLGSLKEELKISQEILNSASREVDRMFQKKYFPEIPIKSDTPPGPLVASGIIPDFQKQESTYTDSEKPEEDKILDSRSGTSDPEVKKLFKRIALKIHPDRLVSEPDGPEKDKNAVLFQQAMNAAEENDIVILSNVAIQIGIEPPEISKEKLKEAEQKIIAIKKEINEIESTYVWHWFFCSCPMKKNEILEKLFELMYSKRSQS